MQAQLRHDLAGMEVEIARDEVALFRRGIIRGCRAEGGERDRGERERAHDDCSGEIAGWHERVPRPRRMAIESAIASYGQCAARGSFVKAAAHCKAPASSFRPASACCSPSA